MTKDTPFILLVKDPRIAILGRPYANAIGIPGFRGVTRMQ